MPAIKLDNVRGGTFENVHIRGFDVGIESVNSSFTARGVTFDGVRQPWDVRGGDFAQVENTRVINDPKAAPHGGRRQTKSQSFSGWRRNGPPLPSQCTHCKTIFPSRNFDFGTARFLSKNNYETCRECRREGARLADGLFDLTAEAVKIIHGPDISYEMLAGLSQVANRLQTGGITEDEAVAQFGLISPAIGDIARRISKLGANGVAYLGLIVAIAALIYSHVQTVASLEQRDSAREQTEMARQALDLQKNSLSTDDLLKEILEQIKDLKIVSPQVLQPQGQAGGQQPSAGPAQTKTPTETGSVNLKPESAPKRKRIRRHSGTGHRYVLHCCCKPSPSRR